MISILEHGMSDVDEQSIKQYLGLILQVPMSEHEKPQVQDEAHNIFSTILNRKLIREHIQLKREKVNVQFRTWVGGDKDGHPFVNEKTMMDSWKQSRKQLMGLATLHC